VLALSRTLRAGALRRGLSRDNLDPSFSDNQRHIYQ
jgi:hypothetical protein